MTPPERVRRRLGLRWSGAAGAHRRPGERPRSQEEAAAVADQLEDEPEDPEGAEETLTARDEARRRGTTVGEFVDSLPEGQVVQVEIDGQVWNVKRFPPIERESGESEH